ncbi:Asp23/Gls24 family envelope stress response protein [Actinophytocola sp. KF-1]
MSDLMNSVLGHAGNDHREAGGTSTIDVEPADALTQEPADADGTPDEADADETAQSATADVRPEAATRGNTTVSDAVVSKVVTMVAGEVDGVHRLDDEDSEVAVDGRVAMIRISLVVEYGQAVTALAKHIRTDVIDAVEEGLGLDVASVDIHVGDIHVPDTDTETDTDAETDDAY